MYSIVVVPPPGTAQAEQFRLAPGERLRIGRSGDADGRDFVIAHEGVPRVAGEITAFPAYAPRSHRLIKSCSSFTALKDFFVPW